MKKLCLIITLFSILIPRALTLNTESALSQTTESNPEFNIDAQNNSFNDNIINNRPDITLFEWDFEEGDPWTIPNGGWELSQASFNSETNSMLSPNTALTYNNSWNVVSQQYTSSFR